MDRMDRQEMLRFIGEMLDEIESAEVLERICWFVQRLYGGE